MGSTPDDATAVLESGTDAERDASVTAAPRRVGRYEVLERLGEGGMGVVYRARDPKLDRVVALKLLRVGGMGTAGRAAEARLLREARAMGQLSHPNVIEVFDVGTVGGSVFIAMELVAGRTLKDWQCDRPWPEIVAAYVQAGRGLAAAHAAELVHRDFKPANVMVGDDGRVRVLDFGLARLDERASEGSARVSSSRSASASRPAAELGASVDDASARSNLSGPLTEAGFVMGTPAYMAPEQAEGRCVDASDQYAFCVALFEAVTGVRPFRGRGARLLAAKLAMQIEAVPRERRPPAWLSRALLRGLAPRPEDRWPSLAALLRQLQRGPGRRRRRLVGAASLVVVTGGLAWTLMPAGPAPISCEPAAAAVDEVWNAQSRAAVQRAIEASGRAFAEQTWTRVESTLDDYAARWRAARRDVCVAARDGELIPVVADDRTACLHTHLSELTAVVEVLGHMEPDEVRGALTTVRGLGELRECVQERAPDADGPRPDDPSIAARVAVGRDHLTRAGVLLLGGRADESQQEAELALAIADEVDFEPLRLEARHRIALALEKQGEFDEAVRMLSQAYFDAQAIGHDYVAVNAAVKLTYILGHELSRTEEGATWARHAKTAVARVPPQSELHARLQATLGNVAARQRDFPAALVHYQAALARWRQIYGDDDNDAIGLAYANLGAVYMEMQRNDEAAEHLKEALRIQSDLFGSVHPAVAATRNNYAVLLTNLGQFEPARAQLQQVLDVYTDMYGPDHPGVGAILSNLGDIEAHLHHWEVAVERYEASLAIFEPKLGPEHPNLAYPLHGLGLALVELGELERAERALERAIALRPEATEHNPTIAEARFGIARARLGRGAPVAEVREAAESALRAWKSYDDARAIDNQQRIEAFLRELDG